MTHASREDLTKRGRYWLEHIRQWQQSHSTQSEYCRRRALSVTAFRWWRGELIRKGIDLSHDGDSHRTDGTSGSFVELALAHQMASRALRHMRLSCRINDGCVCQSALILTRWQL